MLHNVCHVLGKTQQASVGFPSWMKMVLSFKKTMQAHQKLPSEALETSPTPSASPVCSQSEINPAKSFLNLDMFSDKILGTGGHIFQHTATDGPRKWATKWHPSHGEGENCSTLEYAEGKISIKQAQIEIQETFHKDETNSSQSHIATIPVVVSVTEGHLLLSARGWWATMTEQDSFVSLFSHQYDPDSAAASQDKAITNLKWSPEEFYSFTSHEQPPMWIHLKLTIPGAGLTKTVGNWLHL